MDPSTYQDRYQEALQELIEAKMKGLPIKLRAVAEAPPVIDLMSALKRSLAQETPAKGARAKKEKKRTTIIPDRRRPFLLLPVTVVDAVDHYGHTLHPRVPASCAERIKDDGPAKPETGFVRIEKVGFAMDSPLERDGFELPVPRHKSREFPQHSGHCGGLGGLLDDTT